jgi:hypothetical protein
MNTYNLCEQKIQTLFKNGNNVRDISKFYGCSKSLIYIFCKKNKIEIPKLNLIGYKYHWLDVIAKSESKNGQVYWICKCKCGKEIALPTKAITRNEIKSCGCWMKSREYSRNHYLWSGCGDIHGKWWGNIGRGAVKRGHEFKLDIEEAWGLFKKQNGKCALSGIDLKFCESIREVKGTTASLDRIDSNKGYSIDNVQWVHKTVNLMKQGLDMNEFKYWIKMIGDNLEI